MTKKIQDKFVCCYTCFNDENENQEIPMKKTEMERTIGWALSPTCLASKLTPTASVPAVNVAIPLFSPFESVPPAKKPYMHILNHIHIQIASHMLTRNFY